MMKSKSYFPEVIIGFIVEAVYTMYEKINPRTTVVIIFSLLLLFGSYKAISSIKRDRKDKDKLGDHFDDPHYFDKCSVIVFSSNPTKLARKAFKQVKKGNVLLGLEYASEALTLARLKPKIEQKLVELFNSNYGHAVSNSNAHLLDRWKLANSVEDSISTFQRSLEILEQRSTILTNLLKVPQGLSVELESADSLADQISDYQNLLALAKHRAASIHYNAAVELMNRTNRSKSEARLAYREFEKCLSFVPDYLDAKRKKQQAFNAARIIIKVSDIKGSGHDMAQGALQEYLPKRLQTSSAHPFIQISYNQTIQADYSLEITIVDSDVKNLTRDTKTHELEKIITDEDKEITIKSTVLEFGKDSYSNVKAIYRIKDAQGSLIIESEKMIADKWWGNSWGTVSGDSRAVTKDLRRLTEKKELPYPEGQLMINEAIFNLTDLMLPNLGRFFRMVSQ